MNRRTLQPLAGLGATLLLLVGCSGPVPTNAPAAPSQTTIQSDAAPTVASAPSPLPSPAGPLSLPLDAGTPLPQLGAAISPGKVDSIVEVAVWAGHGCSVFSLAFSPDGRTLASSSCDQTLRTWDLDTGSQARVLGEPSVEFGTEFSPDGALLAAWSNVATIRVFDVATGSLLHTLGHGAHVWGAAISPDGKTLASGGEDGTITIWDLDTGSALPALNGNLGELYGSPIYVRGVDYSPDGTMLASMDDDDAVGLWDVATGTSLRRISITDSFSAIFTPDGSMLLVGTARFYNNRSDSEYKATLYDVATGSRIRTFSGDPDKAHITALSPDGSILAIGLGTYKPGVPAPDAAIVLYDVATGEELRRLTGHTDSVVSLAFSPDGTYLASGSSDGDRTIRFWGIYP